MTEPPLKLSAPATPATPDDLRTAQHREQLLRTELTRVRAAAVAWRTGLGALLAALIGFGLIKGRTDIGQLDGAWAAAVGGLLLLALLLGAAGALLLIRAANGKPSVADPKDLPAGRGGEHIEALDSAEALRKGIGATIGCALLLVAAVGTTWYGPDKSGPVVEVTGPAGTFCGSVVRLERGTLTLKTKAGEVPVDLSAATTLRAVAACA